MPVPMPLPIDKGRRPAGLRLYPQDNIEFLLLPWRSRLCPRSGRRRQLRHSRCRRGLWTKRFYLGDDFRYRALEDLGAKLLAQLIGECPQRNDVLLALDGGLDQRIYAALQGLILG